MTANTDLRYAAARRVLLDALSAMALHAPAVVVVGAQAVYLRTGEGDLAIAPYTTDGDLAINPSLLERTPLLEQAMADAGFTLASGAQGHPEPGAWVKPVDIGGSIELMPVDLIVPSEVAPPGGRRGARLGPHGIRTARISVGLGAALIDHSPMVISALDVSDTRSIEVEVAGTSALLVAKAHKIHDRLADARRGRLVDKDASDVVRIMQTTDALATGDTLLHLMADPVAGEATRVGVSYIIDLFGRSGRPGVSMASRAMRLAMDAETVSVVCTTFVASLTRALFESA